MNTICNIKYIDAYYIDSSYGEEKELGKTKLRLHEAYGYISENDNSLLISFIKEIAGGENKDVVKGIVIPKKAVKSESLVFNKDIVEDISLGSLVSLDWRDVVFVSNKDRHDCSVMNTKGILFKVEDDHIVIKNPKTLRKYPEPIKSHPEEKPLFYIIPKSFIIEVSTA